MTAVLVAIAAHVLVVGTQQVERTQPAIVFVCEHGAAQSLIATAYFNKLAAERGLPYRAPRADISVRAGNQRLSAGQAPYPGSRFKHPSVRKACRTVNWSCWRTK
jgi:hypothetical protein